MINKKNKNKMVKIKILFILCITCFFGNVLAQEVQKKVYIDELTRIGCVCKDGEEQDNVGVGACSGHGGVLYWLYVEQPIYGIYENNLPAIPDNKLIKLTPGEVIDLIKKGVELILPHIPKIPFGENPPPRNGRNKKPKNESENENTDNGNENKNEKKASKDCDCSQLSMLSFYFSIIISQILIFILMYVIIKKTLKNN